MLKDEHEEKSKNPIY